VRKSQWAIRSRVGSALLDLPKRAPFEFCVAVLAIAYVALELSPSSYASALREVGAHAHPLLGSPQNIRADEWQVLTPFFEAAVHNHFREINTTSFYGESLRTVFALPLRDWGLVFKPQLWAFFLVGPALAYSLYWATLAALMLSGWSLLLRHGFGFSRKVAALTSVLLFFSPFVQAWWTTLAPQLAFFPWVLLAVLCVRSPARLAVVLTIAIPVWWISQFYLPGIPPMFFLALAVCIAFRPSVFTRSRLGAIAVGAAAGSGIALLYFRPIFSAYAHSLYPGHRWNLGGGLSKWQVLSQVLPGTTTEHYRALISPNICEASIIGTWLPLFAACTADYRRIHQKLVGTSRASWKLRPLVVLLLAFAIISLWQLTNFLAPLSYLLALGFSPPVRALFASGALLLLASAYVVDRLPLRVTGRRLLAFVVVVVVSWLIASLHLAPDHSIRPRDELIVLVPVVLILPWAYLQRSSARTDRWRLTLLLVAIIPTAIGWALFNPLQSTRVMFRTPQTPITDALNSLAALRADHAIAAPGFTGAVLNGIGYRSVIHTIPTPNPDAFKPYFSQLEPSLFRTLFNRYTSVILTGSRTPLLIARDVVALPLATMSQYAANPCREPVRGGPGMNLLRIKCAQERR
jgi:hypothetical protein